MNKKKIFSLFSFLLASVVLVACSSGNEEGADTSEGSEVSVVTSFFPVYQFTEEVAGDRADVTLMVDGGADPHSYEPSAQDVASVNNADIFAYSSEQMEFWAESLLDSVENDELIVARTADGMESEEHAEMPASDSTEGESEVEPIVSDAPFDIDIIGVAGHYHTGDAVTLRAQYQEADSWEWYIQYIGEDWEQVEDLTEDRFEYETTGEDYYVQAVAYDADGNATAQSEPEHIHIDDHEGEDPHIWLDPLFAQDQVNVIRDALIEADPDGEEVYTENAEAFNDELQTLHEDYEAAFEDAENRTFVVQHQAFGYLANRYQLEQIAIGGLSTEVEPSPSRIAEIGQLVEEYNVPVIYYQQGANSSVADTVANETGTETAILYDLETLSDELQESGAGYIEAMRENLESLQRSIN